MQRNKIKPDVSCFPPAFHRLLENAAVFDSSCSPAARVLFIDREDGFYLKSAAPGSLEKEAALTRYFYTKGLATEVLAYETGEQDWLLTRRVKGEDCTHRQFLDQPERLCDILGQRLRMLHELDASDCPLTDKMEDYFALAEENYRRGQFDDSLYPQDAGFHAAEEAWSVISRDGKLLQRDVLLHGDYCLPNVMLDDWRFSGFIDLGNGGMGDRHIDLFWGMWSLWYNLKTDKYTDRFLDAYGRDRVETEMLRIVAAFEVFG